MRGSDQISNLYRSIDTYMDLPTKEHIPMQENPLFESRVVLMANRYP